MVRMHIDDIKRIHIADLRTKYGNQGLDIIGRFYFFQNFYFILFNEIIYFFV